MDSLEEVANSIYWSEIPFEQKNTTFKIFLMAYLIERIKKSSKHLMFIENNNPYFQLKISYKDETYFLAVHPEKIKSLSRYKKRLEEEIILSEKIDGTILFTSLDLNKKIKTIAKKFPTKIVFRDYREQFPQYKILPQKTESQTLEETPEEIHQWLNKTGGFDQESKTKLPSYQQPLPQTTQLALKYIQECHQAKKDYEKGRLDECSFYKILEKTQALTRILSTYRINTLTEKNSKLIERYYRELDEK